MVYDTVFCRLAPTSLCRVVNMYTALCPILFRDRDDWPAGGLDDSIVSVDADALAAEYKLLRKNAPRRRDAGKAYFVGHSGAPAGSGRSNRWEEHYAMALWNLEHCWPRRGGGWHRFLDYQTPLKAKRADCGIGKIDLFGVTDRGRSMVVELKYPRKNSPDSPVLALMEGLRYAAVVEANLRPIAAEIRSKFCVTQVDDQTPPIVQILAPFSWWRHWIETKAAGDWGPALARLASDVEERVRVSVECMATDETPQLILGLNGRKPSLDRPPTLSAVHLDRNPPGFERLS